MWSVGYGRVLGVAAAAALLAALWAGPAAAQVCTLVTTTSVAFGAYDERSASPVNATGQVRVTCDTGVLYHVSLDPGTHSGGSFSPRAMGEAGGLYQLEYNLYTDALRSVIWGDGTGGTVIVTDTALGAEQVIQVFGRVFALQKVGVGLYTDTVSVTVEY